ncbi:Glycosyltransferase involved in cell wall bisynthesis [Friedmanniella luteola]|uniref:Glycosyltransferase involved in cell wall bisynthesis n=1 Tax=Friedmanniella luteola TaxID=546871 RepID=A0A1H1LK21_9ACTN|nr:glycosyltransferase [Friedmanniella luteola]SDR74767.1 Glycosyltransferase involved in cell wall bisynthesis [Friedmanniella luteola]
MRVALVSEHASPLAVVGAVDAGGQNVHVDALAGALARQGHDVTVHTRRDDPAQAEQVRTDAGYRVLHVPAGPAAPLPKDALWPLMPAFADALTVQLATLRTDVVHGHFWMSAWAADRAADALDLPRVVTFHALGTVKRRHQGTDDTSPPERVAVEFAVARAADRVVATCSDEVRELGRMGLAADRTTVVPCGVDATRFTPEQDATPVPARTRRHRVVTVGRPVPRKGFAVVVEALAGLPDTELLVVGGAGGRGPEPELDRLHQLADRTGVADRLHCVGQVPRAAMPALLRSADAVVCAPWYEPFGLVPLEAMACGVPVVAAAVGGMLDSVVEGVTGLLVPPRDPAALSVALGRLLADPDRRARMGAAGRQRVLERYTWPTVAGATADVYTAVLDRRPRAARPYRRG